MNRKLAWTLSIIGLLMVMFNIGYLVYYNIWPYGVDYIGRIVQYPPMSSLYKMIILVNGLLGLVLLQFCPLLSDEIKKEKEEKDKLNTHQNDG